MKAAKTFWRANSSLGNYQCPFYDNTKGRFPETCIDWPWSYLTLDVVMKTGQSSMRLIFAPLAETDSQQYEAAPWPNIAAAGRSGEGKVSTFHLSEPSAPATATQLHQTLLHSVSCRGLWSPFVSLAAFSNPGKCFQMFQEKITVPRTLFPSLKPAGASSMCLDKRLRIFWNLNRSMEASLYAHPLLLTAMPWPSDRKRPGLITNF